EPALNPYLRSTHQVITAKRLVDVVGIAREVRRLLVAMPADPAAGVRHDARARRHEAISSGELQRSYGHGRVDAQVERLAVKQKDPMAGPPKSRGAHADEDVLREHDLRAATKDQP